MHSCHALAEILPNVLPLQMEATCLNVSGRRGHGPHDAAGPPGRNFIYTRTDLTLQGEVHIERAEIPPPFDAIHLISIIARRA